jgi:hypothetical protein
MNLPLDVQIMREVALVGAAEAHAVSAERQDENSLFEHKEVEIDQRTEYRPKMSMRIVEDFNNNRPSQNELENLSSVIVHNYISSMHAVVPNEVASNRV